MDAVQKSKVTKMAAYTAQNEQRNSAATHFFKTMWCTINKKCKVYDIAGFEHAMNCFA
jgi:hypothetical protein